MKRIILIVVLNVVGFVIMLNVERSRKRGYNG